MKITPTSLTISQIFSSKNEQFYIPAYQRRYSWEDRQVGDLFKDVDKLSDSDSHLLGTIVCLTESHVAGLNTLELVDELEDMGVSLKSATELYDTTTSIGQLMFQQLASQAEYEWRKISERVMPGMIQGVKQGNWQGARYSPYGYSYNKRELEKKLRVVEEEAKVVKMIYMMYLAGQSTAQIAGYLYKKGYKTRSGGKFHSKLVCDILKRHIYLGKLVWNKKHYNKKKKTLKGYKYEKNDPSKIIRAEGKHEPIILQEDFDAVQKKMEQNRKGIAVRKGSSEYSLTGILICGVCGHKFQGCLSTATRENKKTKSKRRYYRCCGRSVHYVECSNVSVRADVVEEEVNSIMDVIFSNPEFDEERIESIVGLTGSEHNEAIEREIKELRKHLDKNISQQEKLSKVFSEGYLAEEAYKKQILPLIDQKKELDEKMQRLRLNLIEREKSAEYQKLLKAVVEHCDYMENSLDIAGKKGLLKLVFKNIVISNGRIKKFELYKPFQNLYEGKRIKWQVQENQEVATIPASVSTYAHSDVR